MMWNGLSMLRTATGHTKDLGFWKYCTADYTHHVPVDLTSINAASLSFASLACRLSFSSMPCKSVTVLFPLWSSTWRSFVLALSLSSSTLTEKYTYIYIYINSAVMILHSFMQLQMTQRHLNFKQNSKLHQSSFPISCLVLFSHFLNNTS